MPVLRVLVGLVGATLVVGVVTSAMRTVVLPRGEPVRLTGLVFLATRTAFDAALKVRHDYASRDRLMALYAPMTLLLLPFVWLGVTWVGFAAVLWAVEQQGAQEALVVSGSSLITLGFQRPESFVGVLLSFVEGALAISVLALLLVTYLPSMYSAFSQREEQVSLFEVRGGTPPSAVQFVLRYHRIGALGQTDQVWLDWERWFARVGESHTSLPALVWFRSPDPRHSWVTAAGAVLDAAGMMAAVVDLSQVERRSDAHVEADDGQVRVPQAAIAVRAGFLALRRIADQQGISHDPDPSPDDPISVTRAEFDAALEEMAEAGVPLRPDRDAAWRAWAGWRVNYDSVLLQLAALTVSPPTPWISDRAPVSVPAPQTRRSRMVASLSAHLPHRDEGTPDR